jgi:hypothetical protein
MYLLTLDLGRTTGWASWYDPDRVHKYGNATDLNELFLYIRNIGVPMHVVVEKPVVIRGPLGDEMAALIARTESEYGEIIVYVTAADWKPHPITSDLKVELKRMGMKNLSKHELDAICIGCWYMNVRLQSSA